MNALLLLSVLALAPPNEAKATTTPALGAFGPFDAGTSRPVTRQGDKGLSRRPHPAVGDKGHIPGGGAPPPSLRNDPDLPELAGVTPNAAAVGLSSNPLFLASLVYSNFLTRMDGPRCQHLPTCSRFASQAVGRHGLLGITMGLDRILQPPSSSSVRLLPELEFGGVFRHYDPLENYEFWRSERFSGLAVAVDEQPLALPAPTLPLPPPPSPLPESGS
ncbi:MAG: membrane protein insertion efficiency factor YidD [Deltaproteobacteria bacterium]|nr:membrane protein insertion efficiency factor YidD [Deltaproteobacteria bacterium]